MTPPVLGSSASALTQGPSAGSTFIHPVAANLHGLALCKRPDQPALSSIPGGPGKDTGLLDSAGTHHLLTDCGFLTALSKHNFVTEYATGVWINREWILC